jgi:hypothetical protein
VCACPHPHWHGVSGSMGHFGVVHVLFLMHGVQDPGAPLNLSASAASLKSGEAADTDSGGGVAQQPYQLHPREYYEFRLKGVVVHNGTAYSGHYYSFVRDSVAEAVDCRADDPEVWRKEKWLRFDDSVVRCGVWKEGCRGWGWRAK